MASKCLTLKWRKGLLRLTHLHLSPLLTSFNLSLVASRSAFMTSSSLDLVVVFIESRGLRPGCGHGTLCIEGQWRAAGARTCTVAELEFFLIFFLFALRSCFNREPMRSFLLLHSGLCLPCHLLLLHARAHCVKIIENDGKCEEGLTCVTFI